MPGQDYPAVPPCLTLNASSQYVLTYADLCLRKVIIPSRILRKSVSARPQKSILPSLTCRNFTACGSLWGISQSVLTLRHQCICILSQHILKVKKIFNILHKKFPASARETGNFYKYLNYPFTAPATIPFMIYFWQIR